MTLRVGLLLCDHVRSELLHLGGDYPDYFARLLPEVSLRTYDLTAGVFPEAVEDCEAWVTSGSRLSVYDEVDWIRRFAALIRRLDQARAMTLGICFGAQMMAHALGGRVERAKQGWQVGMKTVEADSTSIFGPEPFRIIHSNADQIVELAMGMRQIASTPTNPIEAVAIGDHFLGLQGHPEFTIEYAAALMHARRGTLILDEVVDEGLASLTQAPDRERLSLTLSRFLQRLDS